MGTIVRGNSVSKWHTRLEYTVSQGDDRVDIWVAAGPEAESNGFDITSGISTTVSVTWRGDVTGGSGFYSATGASGYTEHVSQHYSIAKDHSSYTCTITAKTVNVSGFRNGTSTASYSFTFNPKTSYAVAFDANGGSGAPSSQTKWHGETLTLSSTRPTRSNYKFLGWATSASGDVAYQPGDSYTTNAAATLYAKWQLAYVPPTLTGLTAQRCDSAGAAQDDGAYALVTGDYAADTSADSATTVTKATVAWRESGTTGEWSSADVALGAASGTLSATVGAGALDAGKGYDLTVTLVDSHGATTAGTTSVGPTLRILNVSADGTAIGFGRMAPDAGYAFAGPVAIDGAVTLSEPAQLSQALNSDGWHVLLDGGAWYCKRGGLLLVYLYNITASGSRTVGTLPTGYRPLFPDGADNVFGVAVGPNGCSCNFGINAGGVVNVYPPTSGDWTGLGVFPVAW